MPADRTALGAFLRSRRDRLTPAQAGIAAFPGARRVPGLRKEELAVIAGLSPDYYSRLEQGRQATISTGVLESLARALRLDETERAHLLDLADPPASPRGATGLAQRPDPGLLRIMTALDHLPVILLGERSVVLATNDLFSQVLRELPDGSSFARFMFLDPLARSLIANWSDFAAASIASLRREQGRRPFDTRLTELITELRERDQDVERWWNDHSVRDYASMTKQVRHPIVGDLTFTIESVTPPLDPDQRLVIYTVEPGSETARLLPVLSSWVKDATAVPVT